MTEASHCTGSLLIVDDDPLNVELLIDKIGVRNYQITTASSGRQCLRSLRQETPDLILLDIMMPEMNGYEVCREIKSNPVTANIPVLFMSALDGSDDKVKGFEAGAVDYITKPFDEHEVLARIETHLCLKSAREALENQNQQLDEQVSARTRELVKSNELLRVEIADRKQAQEMLRESEAKSRAIIDALPDSVFEISREGVILSCKGSVSHLHLEPGSIIGNSISRSIRLKLPILPLPTSMKPSIVEQPRSSNMNFPQKTKDGYTKPAW